MGGPRATDKATKKPSKLDALDRFHPLSRAEWRTWLERNHRTSPGIWLVTFKKHTGKPRIDYNQAVEELLCFGWVDSLPRALDDERSMLLCTPRKPASKWSRPNKERVARMEAAGLMAERGRELVELARRTGTWTALDQIENLVIPDDLAERLAAHGPAQGHFEAFPRSVKRGILEWIASAKRPETRARRVEQTAALAAQNIRANQWPRR
ncbi:MAG: YdeI/OmpD-associated family protein [Myxococcota bacterium]